MIDTVLGTRIRQRRRDVGITQAALAKSVGISASYLNLIEWNKRRIAGGLLTRIADELHSTVDELGGIAEERLHGSLLEVAHLPVMKELDVEADKNNELIARFPGWARGIAALANSERDASMRAQVLSDRLANDPYFGEEIHKMLNRMAVIRSAADILVDYDDLKQEQHDRFVSIIHEEIRVLSGNGEVLATYLDKAEHAERYLTPADEVEALFDARRGQFEEIESETRSLSLSIDDPPGSSRWDRVQYYVDRNLGDVIEKIIAESKEIETTAAAERARDMLRDYATGAILIPMDQFLAAVLELRFDIEALSERFVVDIVTICERLLSLPRAAEFPRFGYMRANASGTIISKRGFERLLIPRYAAACPLWILFRAQQSPEAVLRQRAVFPSGDRFVFIARARNTGVTGFGHPRHFITDMLAMSESDAESTVYAPDASADVEEVGPNCRLCPRRSCAHRVEDPLTQ